MTNKIIAVIDPQNLEETMAALESLGVATVALSPCRQAASPQEPPQLFRGKKQTADLQSAVRLEMTVDRTCNEKIVALFRNTPKTPASGERLIFIQSSQEAVSLETGAPTDHPPLAAAGKGSPNAGP